MVTPEYRLSKEVPYPAALENCYAALKYLKEHTEELNVNSSQLMIGGEEKAYKTCYRLVKKA